MYALTQDARRYPFSGTDCSFVSVYVCTHIWSVLSPLFFTAFVIKPACGTSWHTLLLLLLRRRVLLLLLLLLFLLPSLPFEGVWALNKFYAADAQTHASSIGCCGVPMPAGRRGWAGGRRSNKDQCQQLSKKYGRVFVGHQFWLCLGTYLK